jgi:hypothetical protein
MLNQKQVLIILTAAALSWAVPANAASADAPGWVFHQDGSYIGKQDLYVTAAGAVLKTSLATFIIKPKTGTIVAYNAKNKTFVEMPTSEWKKTFAGYFAVTPGSEVQKGSGKSTLSGLSVQQYKVIAHDRRKPYETDEVWSAMTSSIPADVVKAIADFVDLPKDLGLPVKIIRAKHTDTPVKVLDTFKIERVTVAGSLFKVPAGYRKVHTEVEVLLEESDDSTADLMKELEEPRAGIAKTKPATRQTKK